jgi:hypothetical protein
MCKIDDVDDAPQTFSVRPSSELSQSMRGGDWCLDDGFWKNPDKPNAMSSYCFPLKRGGGGVLARGG